LDVAELRLQERGSRPNTSDKSLQGIPFASASSPVSRTALIQLQAQFEEA